MKGVWRYAVQLWLLDGTAGWMRGRILRQNPKIGNPVTVKGRRDGQGVKVRGVITGIHRDDVHGYYIIVHERETSRRPGK